MARPAPRSCGSLSPGPPAAPASLQPPALRRSLGPGSRRARAPRASVRSGRTRSPPVVDAQPPRVARTRWVCHEPGHFLACIFTSWPCQGLGGGWSRRLPPDLLSEAACSGRTSPLGRRRSVVGGLCAGLGAATPHLKWTAASHCCPVHGGTPRGHLLGCLGRQEILSLNM